VRPRHLIHAIAALAVWLPGAATALSIAGPTSEWEAIIYTGLTPDPIDDHQTGQAEADLVGDATFSALYTQYDAGTVPDTSDDLLAFRLRLGSQENPPGYSHTALVGMDADLDGSVDVFIVLDNSGQDQIALYTTGSKSNTSPSTTSTEITTYTWQEDSSNYDWSLVSLTNCSECSVVADLDLDGDGTDYFLSFAVPFDAIVAVLEMDGVFGTTPTTSVSYVIGTSTNPNANKQDLGGIDGDPTPGMTWTQLGATSTPTTVNPVPEPGTAALLGLGLVALGVARRTRG